MTFIVTAGADELDVRTPAPGHITIWSIAWSLAQINRFNGHALRPYSVAEHSLLVCEICEREMGLNVHGLLAALMHDAHEFASGDMHTPGKRVIGEAWYHWETRWSTLVQRCFSIVTPTQAYHAQIHRADLMALATERRDLMQPTPTRWAVLHAVEPVDWVRLDTPERAAHDWEFWRDRFLDRFHELEFARDLQVTELSTRRNSAQPGDPQ
ncbi:hypothetical protein [Methylibium sp.]|uniref:hypothetical protein n=1 Tax=Methylibium sp. TaxID=2067992 RepID=UPI003D0F23F5